MNLTSDDYSAHVHSDNISKMTEINKEKQFLRNQLFVHTRRFAEVNEAERSGTDLPSGGCPTPCMHQRYKNYELKKLNLFTASRPKVILSNSINDKKPKNDSYLSGGNRSNPFFNPLSVIQARHYFVQVAYVFPFNATVSALNVQL